MPFPEKQKIPLNKVSICSAAYPVYSEYWHVVRLPHRFAAHHEWLTSTLIFCVWYFQFKKLSNFLFLESRFWVKVHGFVQQMRVLMYTTYRIGLCGFYNFPYGLKSWFTQQFNFAHMRSPKFNRNSSIYWQLCVLKFDRKGKIEFPIFFN